MSVDKRETPVRAKKRLRSDCETLEPLAGLPPFLPSHLKILQSFSTAKPSAGGKADVEDDAEIWEMAKLFLEKSPRIAVHKKEAKRWRGIHEEALDVLESSQDPSSPFTSPMRVSLPDFVANMSHPGPASPNNPNPPFSPQSPLKPFSGTFTQPAPTTNSFALVTRLLGKKHLRAKSKAAEETNPFLPLATKVEQRLSKLKAITRSKDEKGDDRTMEFLSPPIYYNFRDTTDTAPEDTSDIETEIRLWTMLLHCIKSVE